MSLVRSASATSSSPVLTTGCCWSASSVQPPQHATSFRVVAVAVESPSEVAAASAGRAASSAATSCSRARSSAVPCRTRAGRPPARPARVRPRVRQRGTARRCAGVAAAMSVDGVRRRSGWVIVPPRPSEARACCVRRRPVRRASGGAVRPPPRRGSRSRAGSSSAAVRSSRPLPSSRCSCTPRQHVVDLHVHEQVARAAQRADDAVGLDRDAVPRSTVMPSASGAPSSSAQAKGVGDRLDEHARLGLEAEHDARTPRRTRRRSRTRSTSSRQPSAS